MSPFEKQLQTSASPRSSLGDQRLSEELVQQLEQVLRRIDQGESIDIAELKLQHPEIAADLDQCIANMTFLQNVGALLLDETTNASQEPKGRPFETIREVGDFRIIREIGRGGMGVVFEAEQVSLQRRVALKILPLAAVLDKRAVSRFKNEVLAVAQLDHPNIVDIYAVGCERGVHHYAMRLIDGQPLSEIVQELRRLRESDLRFPDSICSVASNRNDLPGSPETSDRENQSPAQQVNIETQPKRSTRPSRDLHQLDGHFRSISEFGATIAEALDFAHQHGIVHRDVKPSNLMVDSAGKAWITDFGLAQIDTGTGMTMTGDLLGTARYMSPEQVQGNSAFLDHRTDIYSLGVTLYQLLTLELPFDSESREKLFHQILVEEPRKLRKINQAIPSDLETIILKAMEKSTLDRYPTAGELASDLKRYLNNQPILARSPTSQRRARKWMLRNPVVVFSTAVTLVLLTVVSVIFSVFLWQAKEQSQRRLTQVENGVELLASLLTGIDPTAEASGGAPLYQQLAEKASEAADQLRSESIGDELAVARLQTILGRTLRELGDAEKAITVLEQAGSTRELQLGFVNADTLITMNNLADAYLAAGQLDRAVQLFEKTVNEMEATLGADDPHTLGTMNNLANAYLAAGKLDQALPLFEKTVEAMKVELGPDHIQTLISMSNLAGACEDAGMIDRAITLFEKALEAKKAKRSADHSSTLVTMNNLGGAYLTAGRSDDALRILEETQQMTRAKLGPDHFLTLSAMGNLAHAYRSSGKLVPALELFEKQLNAYQAFLSPNHPDTMNAMEQLAGTYQAIGKFDQALELYERTLSARQAKLGPNHPNTLLSMNNVATAYLDVGKPDQAIPLLKETLKANKTKHSPNHPDTLRTMGNLAFSYMEAGQLDKALPLLEETLKATQAKLGPNHPQTVIHMNNLGLTYLNAGQPESALPIFKKTLEWRQDKLGVDHPNTLTSLNNLAGAYRTAGKLEEALPYYEQAATALEKRKFLHQHARFIVPNTASAFEADQQFERAEKWRRKWMTFVMEQKGTDSLEYASALAELGLNLLKQKKWQDAEIVLRDSLTLREQGMPDDWRTFSTKSMFGGALLGQKQYAEAEPQLIAGYDGLKECELKISPTGKIPLSEAVQRLVDLYTATGRPEKAAEWKTKLPNDD